MILVADADVRDPIVQSLQAVRFPIHRVTELNIPLRPDTAMMQGVLKADGLLVTYDTGIPSQAYLYRFGQAGLTMVVVRLVPDGPAAWQKAVEVILRDWHAWQGIATETPSVISITWGGSRARTWEGLPHSMASPARARARRPSR